MFGTRIEQNNIGIMDNITRSHIEQIQIASKQNRLVIFVGAGVSANSGVPTWEKLIKSFIDDLPDQIKKETDYLKIAQLYRDLRGEKEFLDKVKDILKYEKVSPNEIHKEILDLNPCHIVTTNYDDLLEQSALTYNHQYYVVKNDKDLPANKGEKMIIKMHGDFSLGNIVLTENDYFDYSRNFPLIKSYVVSLFATKLVLFVGFSFNDINLKYILRNVRNVLGDKMQQAYMLTDKCLDSLTNSYYKSKGVCIINNNDIKTKEEQLGENIKQQLYEINHYDKYEDDIIEIIISFLKEYGDQIAYLGKYIINIFPKEKRKYIYMSTEKMSLSESYKKKFEESVLKESSKEDLYNKYGDEWYELTTFLLNNQINKIENFSLETDEYLNEYKKRHPLLASDMYYDLDMVQINNHIRALRSQPLKYTKEDLQLPFILYKIGNHLEAYKLFNSLSKEFWKKRKYFLYFICLYNTSILIRLFDNGLDSLYDTESLEKEFAVLDMQKILNDLPLEDCLKSVLRKVLDFSVVKDLLIEVSKLQEELERQKKSAQKGGFSINSNVINLLYNFRQSFDFCNENCLVYDIYSESKNVYEKIAKGIIDSVMTPVIKDRYQSKLEALTEDILPIFIFQLEPDDLRKILNSHTDKALPITDNFRNKLVSIVDNLASSLNMTYGEKCKVLPQKVVAKYIKNIIVLCLYVENPPILNHIYELILDTWNEGEFVFDINGFMSFLKTQKPTCDNALQLLKRILYSNMYKRDVAEIVLVLSDIIREEGKKLDDLESIDKIKCQGFPPYTASFINIVKPKIQEQIVQYVQKNASCLQDLVLSELWTGAAIITPDFVKKFADKIQNIKYPYYEEYICCELVSIVQNRRPDLQMSLVKFAKKNECIKFFMNPFSQKNYSNISAKCLMYCEKSILNKLLKIEQIRVIAKEHIRNNPYDENFKKIFFELV